MGQTLVGLHEEARGTRELIFLARDDLDVELLTGEVIHRRREGLHNLAVVVHAVVVGLSGLEALQGVGLFLVLRAAARCVVIGSHGGQSLQG